MNTALRTPVMSREEFFEWAQAQNERYEFDGFRLVAMTGGPIIHSRLHRNLNSALDARLVGNGCEALGPDAGVATIGDAVRYPDSLVTCTKVPGSSYLVPGVVVIFEVLSPTSGRTDRIVKLREYRAVSSIRRYVILEYTSIGLLVFSRANGANDWTATALTAEDTLRMPEIGIEIPVAKLYRNVDLSSVPGEAVTSPTPA